MYVCICNAVTEGQIRQAVARGARTIADLQRRLNLGSRCGACECFAEEVLEAERQHDGSTGPHEPRPDRK
ncbi:MAG TPA: (2Fe-2S)-binding protein [Gammaproteobacteria bacterium]|nr:(2Fe-2S)-binding protein [Gammaproteobacteria bacterium]